MNDPHTESILVSLESFEKGDLTAERRRQAKLEYVVLLSAVEVG